MVWVELGSVVVMFGLVISMVIVLRVRRLHDVDDVLRVQLALVSSCWQVVGGGVNCLQCLLFGFPLLLHRYGCVGSGRVEGTVSVFLWWGLNAV